MSQAHEIGALGPEIAVVVPVHNGARTLHASLTALLEAPGPSREIIVVDDGSNDGSAEIARALDVRIIRQSKAGDGTSRNRGVEETSAPIIVFVDADVVIHADALERIADFMAENRDYAAVIGSYDAAPSELGFVNQYRNLLHHFTHQSGHPEAKTFFTGLGAIRRSAFEEVGPFRSEFDPIADIALGLTLHDAGYRIRLDRELQGKHLKAWTLRTFVTTDILSRALPWTKLILSRRRIPNGLSTEVADRLAVASAMATVVFAALAFAMPVFGLVAALCLAATIGADAARLRQFRTVRGATYMLCVVPLQFLHRICAGVGFLFALTHRVPNTPEPASRYRTPAFAPPAIGESLTTTSSPGHRAGVPSAEQQAVSGVTG